MMALFTFPLWIFLARTTDRLGKGLRTAARDALLSQNATAGTKARVFAFHRGMDTLGAVAGPLLALTFLHLFPKQYSTLFYLALFPGLVAVALLFLLKEKPQPSSSLRKGNFFSYLGYWKVASPEYRKLVIGLLLFALFNSSDVFLLLKAKELTGSDTLTIAAYIFYNGIYAVASYPVGILADKLGFKMVFTAGLLLFGTVYFMFAGSGSTAAVFLAFFIYGIYAAATEGIAKAWLTNLAPSSDTATAIGFYTSAQSICTLVASSIAGLLWTAFGSATTFAVTGVASICIFFYMRSGAGDARPKNLA